MSEGAQTAGSAGPVDLPADTCIPVTGQLCGSAVPQSRETARSLGSRRCGMMIEAVPATVRVAAGIGGEAMNSECGTIVRVHRLLR